MTTIREDILAYAVTVFAAVPSVTVYRSRESAVARSEGNAILIAPEAEQVEKRTALLALRNLTIAIGVIVRGEIPDQIADPIVQQVHALIMADPTLGGLCAQLIESSTEWKFEEADLTACEVTLRYIVRYQTTTSDLTRTT